MIQDKNKMKEKNHESSSDEEFLKELLYKPLNVSQIMNGDMAKDLRCLIGWKKKDINNFIYKTVEREIQAIKDNLRIMIE